MSDENPLKDRFDPIEPDQEDQSSSSDSSQTEETEGSDSVDKSDNTDKVDKSDNTEGVNTTDKTDEVDNADSGSDADGHSKSNTRRDRPHTAMYISADLVDRMKDRYRKINGELMINEGEEIELNKHFYEGLIKAGLENPELKELVLAQRDEE